MRYRLDPDLPVTARSATELRIGDAECRATLPDTQLVRALIDAAQIGGSRTELLTEARNWQLRRGQEPEPADHLVDQLLRACTPLPDSAPPAQAVLVRTSTPSRPLAEVIAGELARRHHRVALGDATTNPQQLAVMPSLVIDVADRVLSARRYLQLETLEVPHLAVVRETGRVVLGPFTYPGFTPCQRCDDLHRLDLDPSWLAIATQLAALPAPTHPLELRWAAALTAAEYAAQLLEGLGDTPLLLEHPLADTVFAITRAGVQQVRRRNFHDGCDCRVLPEIDSAQPTLPTVTSSRTSTAGACGHESAPHTAVAALQR